MSASRALVTALLAPFGIWCVAATVRTVRELLPDLLSEEERDPLGEVGRRLKDRWDRIVDRVTDWLEPEPEPVPVPVRWPHDGERR